jgi:hypothetical protein
MFIRKLGPLVAMAAFGLLALGANSASATTLRFDPGNVAAPTNTIRITNTSSAPSVLTTGIGSITCNSTSFTADINNNHATILTGTLTQLTFTTCSDTIPLVTILSCHRHASPLGGVSIHANASGSTQTLTDIIVRCGIAPNGAVGCYFTAASAAGTSSNANSTLSFPGVSAVAITSPTTDAFAADGCGGTGTFSATLRHIVEEGTNRTITVTQ